MEIRLEPFPLPTPPTPEPALFTLPNPNAILFATVVLLWASVLIPMWLRRHRPDPMRRINQYHHAMGTLARMCDTTGETRGVAAARVTAARRRHFTLVVSGTLGALVSLAWTSGLLPQVAVVLAWLPMFAFITAMVIMRRHHARIAALRAFEVYRRAYRARCARIVTPKRAAAPQRVHQSGRFPHAA